MPKRPSAHVVQRWTAGSKECCTSITFVYSLIGAARFLLYWLSPLVSLPRGPSGLYQAFGARCMTGCQSGGVLYLKGIQDGGLSPLVFSPYAFKVVWFVHSQRAKPSPQDSNKVTVAVAWGEGEAPMQLTIGELQAFTVHHMALIWRVRPFLTPEFVTVSPAKFWGLCQCHLFCLWNH